MKIINGIKFHNDYNDYEITEEDVSKAVMMFGFKYNEDKIWDIYCALSGESLFSKEKTPINKKLAMRNVEYLVGLGEPDCESDNNHLKNLMTSLNAFTDSLQYRHSGDCTKNAFSCPRCYFEKLLEIDTTNNIDMFIETIEGLIINWKISNKEDKSEKLEILKDYLTKNKETCIEVYNSYANIHSHIEEINTNYDNVTHISYIDEDNDQWFDIKYFITYSGGYKDYVSLDLEDFIDEKLKINKKKKV